MVNLKVELGDKTYPLFIGNDILSNVGEIYKLYGYKPCATLITNLNSKKNFYFDSVVESFKKRNIEVNPIFLTDRQLEQGLVTVQEVALQLAKQNFQPEDTIVSIGGSRVASISAFIAQMIYGGTPYLQIPTTLTSQIVQSVEPVSRINFDSHLNLFSINFAHSLVWTDVALLKTLPERNFISGFGYIIQSACLSDDGFFEFLENNLDDFLKVKIEILEETIFRSCRNRIDFLNRTWSKHKKPDPYNLGEFVASIVSEASGSEVRYGETLLVGIFVEGIASFKSGIFDGSDFERFYELFKRVSLNRVIDQINRDKIINYLNNENYFHQFPALHAIQGIGQFKQSHKFELSDFLLALDLAFSI